MSLVFLILVISFADRFTQHRYKCDQAFELNPEKSPVAAYLDIDYITDICIKNGVQAVHPGYGFLSENERFANSLEKNGIVFVGPTVENLRTFGDKTAARRAAIEATLPKDQWKTNSEYVDELKAMIQKHKF